MPSTLSRIRQSALPRLIDRAAGSPLLWLLGVLRPRRPFPMRPQRIGILMFETVGDTLLASTLIASLRMRDPAVKIVVFASSGNAPVLSLVAGIDQVVQVPLTRPLAAVAAMRSVGVDVAIDIGQWPRWYALLCVLSRSRYTIGFDTPGQSRHHAYDCPIEHRRDVHEIENFQRLLLPFSGARPVEPSRALKPVGAVPVAIASRAPYVAIHPWASGFNFPAREWPTDCWVELVRRICGAHRTVLITGSPADRQRARELAAHCGDLPVQPIAGDGSWPELAAILRGADAVVAVNTGVMHLAALLDVPLVALHGPTSRRRWGPLGTRSTALAPPAGVRAEFLHLGFEYPRGDVDCMKRIGIEDVWRAVQTHLAAADGDR